MIQEYFRFIAKSWPLLLFGMLAVFWGNFGQSFFISWYGTDFQNEMGLSATQYGSAYSFATLLSGLSILWAGAIIDKVSVYKFITFCTMGLLAAALTIWQADSLIALTIGLFLLRFFGQGLLPHTAITTMMKRFNSNRGKAVSIATTGVPLGEIILPSLAVLMLLHFGWQKSWLFVGLSAPILLLPLAFFLLKKGEHQQYVEQDNSKSQPIETAHKKDGSRYTLLHDNNFWCALPAILAAPAIITGIFIHQGFILEQMNWSSTFFAKCFIIYGIAHWFASMYAGSLVDRYSGMQLLKFFPLPMAAALLIPLIYQGNVTAFALLTGLGFTIGSSSPIVNALWAEAYGTRFLGSIRAMITSLIIISTSVSPILFGYLIDHNISISLLFAGLFCYVTAAVCLTFFSYSSPSSQNNR